MHGPSLLLLLWCGLAATIGAAIAGTLIGGSAVPWSLAPRPRAIGDALVWSVLGGITLYPLAYGILFDALHRADIRIGVLLGAIHGIIMFVAADPRADRRAAFRVGAAHLVYAVTLAFLYVTP